MTNPSDTDGAANGEGIRVWAVIAFAGFTEFQPQWTRDDARKHARRVGGKVWRIAVRRIRRAK